MGERLATIDVDAAWCELLGLEYDVASETPDAGPGLFARLRSDRARAGVSDTAIIVSSWLAGAVGWRLSSGEREALGRAFDELAASGGLVCDVGIMPGRPGRTFKITSQPMEPARALAVLDRLQWQGPTSEAAAFLSAFSGLFRSLRLTFGIAAGGVSPRIGFELFQGEPGSISSPGVGEWAPCLARLCEDGLCLPKKMEGLLAWPGSGVLRAAHPRPVDRPWAHQGVFREHAAWTADRGQGLPGRGLDSLREGAFAVRVPMSRRRAHAISQDRRPGRRRTRRERWPRASKRHCRRRNATSAEIADRYLTGFSPSICPNTIGNCRRSP